MSCSQLISKNNGLGLLFKTILWRLFCSLSFVATDGKDGNGLKLEKLFKFWSISTKNTKKLIMGCAYLKQFIKYSPHSYQEHFNLQK